MIHELKDDEILDFLMTSEFEQDYKPEELKYLLHKYRYFYRVLSGKYDLLKVDCEGKINKLNDMVKSRDNKINEELMKNASMSDTISSLKNRKLTLKERISGKIISNNENK
jgi:hypothetical protein